MHQLKRNSVLILKTFLYQVVMSLFGFMMYSAIYKIPFLAVIGQGIITVFFLYIMFHQMYQQGAKACEYDWAHKLTSSPALGILFAFVAFLPAIILSAGTVISAPFALDGTPTASYAPFLINKTFLQGMYIGIVQFLFPTSATAGAPAIAAASNAQCFAHLISCIPGLLSCGIGYAIGYLHFKRNKKKN